MENLYDRALAQMGCEPGDLMRESDAGQNAALLNQLLLHMQLERNRRLRTGRNDSGSGGSTLKPAAAASTDEL